ncbi:MAG: hypothetical protein KC468_04755, partial [Myxococcales bacterium]|nr:hypothetical protein [Myxococcales bacterium]
MELLVSVLAELLLALVLTIALLLIAGALLGVSGLLSAWMWSARRRAGGPPPKRAWALRLGRAALLSLGGVILALVLLQTVLLAPVIRHLAARLEARAGLQLRVATVDAALLRGRVTLGGLELARARPGQPAVELRVDQVTLDVDLLSLLGDGPRVLERVHILGLKGQITTPAGERPPEPTRPRARLLIRALTVEDLALTLRDAGARERALTLTRLRVAPLRGDHLIYDILMHAEGSGALGPVALSITRDADETRWAFGGLELDALRPGFRELTMDLSGGTIEAAVVAREAPAPELELGLALRGLRVTAAGDATRRRKIAAALLSTALRARDPLHVSFTVALDPARFEGAMTLAETGLRDDVALGLARALTRLATGAREGGLRERATRAVGDR